MLTLVLAILSKISSHIYEFTQVSHPARAAVVGHSSGLLIAVPLITLDVAVWRCAGSMKRARRGAIPQTWRATVGSQGEPRIRCRFMLDVTDRKW